jgi:PAS domain S-box-containing protein
MASIRTMKFFQTASIQRKQMLIILVSSAVALLLACLAFGAYEVISYRRALVLHLSTLAEIVGNNSTAALDFNDHKVAEETLSGLRAEPDILGAVLYNREGAVWALYQRPGRILVPPAVRSAGHQFRQHTLELFMPVRANGELIGTVFLRADSHTLYDRLQQYVGIALGVFCVAAVVSLLISASLMRMVTEPILSLLQTTRTVAHSQDFSVRADRQTKDELGALVDGFNEMLNQIQQRDAALKQARETLEVRVIERTRELEQEVTERVQVEAALRAQEERTRLIIDQASDAVITVDSELKITGWNLQAEKTLGWSSNEIISCDLLETVIPESRRASRHAEATRFAETGEWAQTNRLHETTALTRQGKTIPVEVTMTPIRLGTGYFFTIFLRDISERKRAESELRWQTALLEAQVSCSPDGVLIVDGNSKKVLQNQRMIEIWKLPREVADDPDDGKQVRFVASRMKDPQQFLQRIVHLNSHPDEVSHEEIELVDGTFLDRWSYPVTGKDGTRYGRLWTFRDITERKNAEARLAETQRQLLDLSRQAGMAEVATSVLHNVGNVLNSVNVSASIATGKIKRSKVGQLAKVVQLMTTHATDIAQFMSSDPKGQKLPQYLAQLSDYLHAEQSSLLAELDVVTKNIAHIKDIVSMQQSYARVSGLIETLNPIELVEDSLRLNETALARHSIKITRDYQPNIPAVPLEKHKVLQILINLVRNAKYACEDSPNKEKRIVVRVATRDRRLHVSITDNGIGIPAENLNRIFNFGFTTRKNGHGFGLHSGALAAKEMGGALHAQSNGHKQGATFILELPLTSQASSCMH